MISRTTISLLEEAAVLCNHTIAIEKYASASDLSLYVDEGNLSGGWSQGLGYLPVIRRGTSLRAWIDIRNRDIPNLNNTA